MRAFNNKNLQKELKDQMIEGSKILDDYTKKVLNRINNLQLKSI